jgi:trehalose-6-phosphatase
MIVCFDIDGTICDSSEGYEKSKPFANMIDHINDLYDEGHIIKIYTARGKASGVDWEQFTIRQLFIWGLHYHEIHFNKPSADLYIDDKAVNIKDYSGV